MLSKDRSPRSESICPVERSSFCDTGSNARLAMKGSVQQSSVNRPEDSEHVPVIPGPGSSLMTGTGTRYPVSGTRFHRPLLVYQSYQVIRSHRVIRSDQFSLVRKLKRKRLTSIWTGLSFLFLIHRVDRCN